MFFIKEMPENERPREKLIQNGVESLSNIELLAILLQTGTKKYSVVELSKKIIFSLDDLGEFNRLSYQELTKLEGIGQAKATTILATLEFSKRVFNQLNGRKSQISSPKDIYMLYQHKLDQLEQEHFYTLYLDTKNQIISEKLIFIGTLNQSVIHPREIYKHAVKVSANSVIFIHNHPSGDSSPSQADYKTTTQLEQSGQIMGVQVIDHIVIGKNQFFSIKENRKYHF
ncbi:MAG: DNA repair protein RadC [Acholeplasma sp.]|nr:DNA repair protein RadC [Acholeplasma sp.]